MEKILKAFNNHGFIAQYFNNKEEAVLFLKENIKNEIVSFGGSMTLKELELYKVLSENNKVLWHWENDKIEECMKANVFLTSANAITKTGEVINIDGTGNRVRMLTHGPSTSYVIVGKNKICDDLITGYNRCKSIACVKNAIRLNIDTPCTKELKCVNCNHKQRICRVTQILERPTSKMKVYIIIINEDLGY